VWCNATASTSREKAIRERRKLWTCREKKKISSSVRHTVARAANARRQVAGKLTHGKEADLLSLKADSSDVWQ